MHKRNRKTFVITRIELEILKCYIITRVLSALESLGPSLKGSVGEWE